MQPLQPLEGEKDQIRFKPNKIVQVLKRTSKLNMDDLATMDFPIEDWEQFVQLIGYSVVGFGELSYVTSETRSRVDKHVEESGL